MSSLPCDPEARWIHSRTPQTGGNSASVLYAIPFVVQTTCIQSATLELCWACDDNLGDTGGANPAGAYINGLPTTPIIAGGPYNNPSTQMRTITGMIHPGVNYLYLYQRNNGQAASGLIFSARIDVTCCAGDFSGGFCDCFVPTPPEPANPSPALVTYIDSIQPNPGPIAFDAPANNHWFVHTFRNLPRDCVVGGVFCMRVRPSGLGSENDTFTIGRVEPDGSAWTQRWSFPFSQFLTSGQQWNRTFFPEPPPYSPPNCGLEICFDLTAEMVTLINQFGTLDLYIQDDTAIDCTSLRLFTSDNCCTRPPRNMVAWLPFDEVSGNSGAVTNNTLGQSDGVLAGNGAFLGSPGMVGRAICFDEGHVDVPFYYPALGIPDAVTLDAWINPWLGGPAEHTLVDKRQVFTSSIGWRGFRWYLDATLTLKFEVSDGNCYQLFTGPLVAANLWQHVAVTFDRVSGVCNFAHNGSCSPATPASATCTITSLYAATQLRIGDSLFGASPSWYAGCMDELEIFPRVLACNEIQAIHTAGAAGKCKEFCANDWDKAFCGNQQTVQTPVRICNATSSAQTYTLSFAPVPGCGNLAWTNFPSGGFTTNPPGPTFTVAPGDCAIVWLTIPRPPFTPPTDQVTCYEVCMTNVNTGEVSCCTGSLTWTGPRCGRFNIGNFNDLPSPRPPLPNFELVQIEFEGPPNSDITYIARVSGPDMEPDLESVSLNGLPPGEPVIDTLTIDGSGHASGSISVAFLRDEPMQPFDILLQADVNGDGDLEVIDSIGIMNRLTENTLEGCVGTHVSDDMEFYPLGPACVFGNWEEWSGSADVCGTITTEQAFSGMRSMKIVGSVGGSTGLGDDTVLRLNIAGGRHVIEAMTFVPSNAQGTGWIVLLSGYPAPFNWSMNLQFDAGAGVVRDQDQPTSATALVLGQWTPVVVDIDLDADAVSVTYNGVQFITGKSWINGSGSPGLPEIQAIDLYAGEPGQGGTTGMYFDDVVVREVCQTAPPCPGDLDGDRDVDIADLSRLLSSFGGSGSASDGDLDGDGDIDLTDLAFLLARFGTTCP